MLPVVGVHLHRRLISHRTLFPSTSYPSLK
nr:MAG TPA: hypothetical protein [Caudoviricetes sp.]